jgi:hypothetical protein
LSPFFGEKIALKIQWAINFTFITACNLGVLLIMSFSFGTITRDGQLVHTATRRQHILGAERALVVEIAPTAGATAMTQRENIANGLWTVFVRCLTLTNQCYARGLGYDNISAFVAQQGEDKLIGPLLKRWLEAHPTNTGAVISDSHIEALRKVYLGHYFRDWKPGEGDQAKLAMIHAFGEDGDALRRDMNGSRSWPQSKVLTDTLISVMCAVNREEVRISVDTRGRDADTMGAAMTSFGAWRKGHSLWNRNDASLNFNSTRMERHLLSAERMDSPIYLSAEYFQRLSAAYDDAAHIFGHDYDNNDAMCVTLLHEASHMYAAAEDHWYFYGNDADGLRAVTNEGHTVSKNQSYQCETNLTVVNADSIGWFLFWFGGGKTIGGMAAH